MRLPSPPWSPSIATAILLTSRGSSPNDSYVRPQRSSRATQMHGANAHCGPDARVSCAVTSAMRLTSFGSRVAPRPMLCGKTVAPIRLAWPCTESTPYRSGMPSRVSIAASWKSSTMSAQASGVFGVGTDPPPDRTLPSFQVRTSDGSPATSPRSAWVIWPTFSSRVIRPTRSATRCFVGSEASW